VNSATKPEIGGSEYLKAIHNLVRGDCPDIDMEFEKSVQSVCLSAIHSGIVKSAHDVSDGGLGVALAECCIQDREKLIGVEINIKSDLRKDFLLFGESQSRIIVTLLEKDLKKLFDIAGEYNVPVQVIGKVGGKKLIINDFVSIDVDIISNKYYSSIESIMKN
jgi:phosphoribosylformylglycinamidine synthase